MWLGKIGDLLDHKADTKALAALELRLRDEAHERLDELARPLEQQVEEASAQLHRGVQEAADAQTEVRRRVDALEAEVHDKSQARPVLHGPRHALSGRLLPAAVAFLKYRPSAGTDR